MKSIKSVPITVVILLLPDFANRDAWTSMGQESESKIREAAFIGFEVLAQKVFCKPQLGNDLAHRQIATEALVTCAAKTTTHGATRL